MHKTLEEHYTWIFIDLIIWDGIKAIYTTKLIVIPVNFSICFGYSKEPSHWDGSFEYPQHMFWLRNKKNTFFCYTLLIKGLYNGGKWIKIWCQYGDFCIFYPLYVVTSSFILINPCPAEFRFILYWKQCRSRSSGFWQFECHLIRIHTVFHSAWNYSL